MKRPALCYPRIAAAGLLAVILGAGTVDNVGATEVTEATERFPEMVRPFFSTYCTDCHGHGKKEGNLTLADLEIGFDDRLHLEKWRMISERIRFLDMPPATSPQPPESDRHRVLSSIRNQLLAIQGPRADPDLRPMMPEHGNHIDHDVLFNSEAGPVIPTWPRIWRIRPEIYASQLAALGGDREKLEQPFNIRTHRGLRDYASQYFIDEPAADLLLRNAELVVAHQAENRRFAEVFEALQADHQPTDESMVAALSLQFRLAVRREPSREETERFLHLWRKNISTSGHPIGSAATLMTVLMLPEAVFRFELGSGEPDALGRLRLTQKEIAYSLSFALRNNLNAELFAAAHRGDLATREQIVSHTKRLLDAPLDANPRLLQFFREFFGYGHAVAVFKDKPNRGVHSASQLVNDLEFLIRYIVERDQGVLARLLTTDEAFINWSIDPEDGSGVPACTEIAFETVYGLPPDWKWTAQQPISFPPRERAGVLTHPAWLVAWSGNFDNDPVRRGKWIRTHLLGGSVPEVPIGVDARVPKADDQTLRDRLRPVTTASSCWRCHNKMDPLGLPFEQYTHYGRFRSTEIGKPVETHGWIDRTGDPELDGTHVADPFELMAKLASSERVEQVFVRHAFRFFLGRNETSGDAATLQDAWKAYRGSDGSFAAIVLSLLTSDSFLYRAP